MTHAAMNLITGEIRTTNSGNHLKRCIARATAWDRANGFYQPSKWVFAHGDNWQEALGKKYAEYAKSLSK